MSTIPEIRMLERCASCAYRPGTVASRHELTQNVARLCLWAAEPFVCHEGDREALCAGWADALQKQVESGKNPPEWKRRVAATCLDVLERARDGAAVDLPAEIRATLATLELDAAAGA